MITGDKLKQFEEWIFKTSAYSMAINIIEIDKQTVAPVGGEEYRDERTAYLAGELFSIETDPTIYELLKEIKDDNEVDSDTRKAAQLYYENISKIVCIPKREYVEFQQLCNTSYSRWLEAKQKKDYSIFEPYLKQLIETKKKFYGYRNSTDSIYNQMLDDFEPNMNTEKYDAFFSTIKEKLVPFIQKVKEAPQIDDAFLFQDFDIETQKKYMDHMLEYLHFDKEWGYQNETEHPFTSWTCENDCRTTTKYLKDNVMSALFSTIHEVGHAYYEHDVNPKYDGMILSEGISSGMHESQSRLCENYLGRTKAFWEYNYPYLKQTFPQQFEGIDIDTFIKAVNVSRPSLIRTEADELTYPIHILIRYELEKGLFDGSISTEGLDKTWADKYEEYLGIRPTNPSEGILQDVHWSAGEFGYFPTYALGSAFSAQFIHKMREEIPVDEYLRNNEYTKCIDWLKENIHQYGCRYNAEEIMLKATGEAFNMDYYIDYLVNKYSELYNL